ncbi:MAG TPA: hypothetical protein VKB34_04495, partial [Povalibacter sp.]|nr:hypothetical protein [Povalibacter sp.]
MTISSRRSHLLPVAHATLATARGKRSYGPLLLLLTLTLTCSAGHAQQQQAGQTITPQFKEADLSLVVQAVQSI